MAANETYFDDFILLGFSEAPNFFSLLFAMIYTMVIIGNLTVFSIIRVDRHLHTPMYFFLSCLSILDVCYATAALPAMLVNAITGNRKISFNRCFTQLYFFVSFSGAESFLLAAMAYDRYVAICNPLHYLLVMNKMFCSYFVAGCWIYGFLNSTFHTLMTVKLTFCGARQIHHYFCDLLPMLQAACSYTESIQVLINILTVFMGASPFLLVLYSYVHIISAILKIRSSAGRQKAFSTCSSHITVVNVFYITGMFNYNGPISGDYFVIVQVSSILCSVLTPLFNPAVYCLRNIEVKRALRKALTLHIHPF